MELHLRAVGRGIRLDELGGQVGLELGLFDLALHLGQVHRLFGLAARVFRLWACVFLDRARSNRLIGIEDLERRRDLLRYHVPLIHLDVGYFVLFLLAPQVLVCDPRVYLGFNLRKSGVRH